MLPPMQLHGIHHLTAITADVRRNHAFYTKTLGLRLVKKTVNQDDVSAYHLFYADGKATPGTDVTFFDWPLPPEQRGTHSIVRTGLRVGSEGSLQWWDAWLTEHGVQHGAIAFRDGRATLELEDPEGQRLALVADDAGEVFPWSGSSVPIEHQIRGLGPITISVPRLERTDRVLREVMFMRPARQYGGGDAPVVFVYEMGDGGAAAELHVAVEPDAPFARQGAGASHHVAFRTTEADYSKWVERLAEQGMPSSGPVNRYYFQSLYFREPNGILFEIATDEPGFTADEPLETLGQKLSLPPFLEGRRRDIEAGLKPLS
jgi:glyoxalase family protein